MNRCTVYIATPMTGRSKKQQLQRAYEACYALAYWGLRPISPVIEENVSNTPGVLVQDSLDKLKGYWKRDKDIMSYEARVTLIDGADEGSVGVAREYGFNRYCLWKPTVIIWKQARGYTVAEFEDDFIVVNDLDAAARIIKEKWGTWPKYAKWRLKMLIRTLPKWIWRQIAAWK